MKFLLAIFFIFSLSISNVLHAQSDQPRFNLVKGEDGITLGQINSITQDLHKVMWFTDQNNRCIIRYDGTHMTRFQNDPKNPNSLGGTYPECIITDSSGIVWIGFYGGTGLDKFDPSKGTFTHFRHHADDPGSLASDTVSALLIDHLGNLCVGTNGGLDLYIPATGKFKHYAHRVNDSTSLSYNIVRVIYEDHEGTLWVGTGFPFNPANDEGGLNRLNRQTGTFTRYLHDPENPHSLINNKVRAIFEDSRGAFWVGTAGDGLHTMDRKTGMFERHTYDPAKPDQLSRPPLKGVYDHITFITEDAEGEIWIGTFGNGLVRYDPKSKTIIHYGGNDLKNSNGLNDISFWQAYISSDGMLWLCTQVTDHLYHVDLFTTSIPTFDIINANVNGISEDPLDIILLATDSGLIRKDFTTGKITRFKSDPNNSGTISPGYVSDIIKSSNGSLWLATGNGLNNFDLKTETFTRYPHDPANNKSLASNNTLSLYEDPESNLWIGTWDVGVDRMNLVTGTFTHYRHNDNDTNSLSNNTVTSILENGPDDFWIGTWNNGGLNSLNFKTGKMKHYLQGISISNILRDRDSIIWIGTEDKGLFRYNRTSDEFVAMNEENSGFDITNVRSLIEDKEGNLWIGSFSGIYMINPQRNREIFFGRENGIGTQTLQYKAAYQIKNGQILFGIYGGYFMLDPAKLKTAPAVPKIELSGFWINNELIKSGHNSVLSQPVSDINEIRLHYNENIFSLSFGVIDYGDPSKRKVFYKLENYDRDWLVPGSESRAYYFNIPPGKYIFRVKAVNYANGEWQEKDVTVVVLTPWWKTWWAYVLYGLLFLSLAYAVHRFQRTRLIKAERERTREREMEQAREIAKAYEELKVTQSQLIQSEKMASLGELTAGIAHEIQNPLNFVNNFSEVNKELLEELKAEVDKGNLDEIKTIATDVIANEEKINHHGKRADAIVKGMLQHSRQTTGIKEPTDINALCDEYLRLSYHGLRAKDKTFEAETKTDFDPSIGKINIVPQDIGRVILNLINNAFYAVNEKKKLSANSYQPLVEVKTRSINDKIEIIVSDNGNGIPDSIRNKIFQPFFTTKPAGSGTGLGLSLSYDIIKAHGGEIKAESKEGTGTEFNILLPVA